MIKPMVGGLLFSLLMGWPGSGFGAQKGEESGRVRWDPGEQTGRWEWGKGSIRPGSGDRLSWRVRKYEAPSARTNVVIFPELGMSGEVFDAGGRGLGPYLQGKGFRVYTLLMGRVGTTRRAYGPERAREEAVQAGGVIASLASERAGERWVLLGHGIGGGLVYRVLTESRHVSGVIALNVPFSSGGSTRAFVALVEGVNGQEGGGARWETLLENPLGGRGGGKATLGELLLGGAGGSGSGVRFGGDYAVPMEGEKLRFHLGSAPYSPTPFKSHWVNLLAERPEVPALIILAGHDGWSPPWQCDPKLFGLARANIVREHLTRANGQALEYNHLDLLLGPNATEDVFDVIVDWLEREER